MNQIDHKNNIRNDNNRWCNLRIANNQLNQANSKISKNNSAGAKGVYWSKQNQKWAAKINPNRKQVHLGFYNTVEEASRAYERGAKQFFGEFARS